MAPRKAPEDAASQGAGAALAMLPGGMHSCVASYVAKHTISARRCQR